MKNRSLRSAVLLLAVALVTGAEFNSDLEAWEIFKKENGKIYDSVSDEMYRFTNYYLPIKRRIDAHNERYKLGLESYDMKPSPFSDLSPEERKRFQNGFINIDETMPQIKPDNEKPVSFEDLPDSIDWRDKNVVTSVKKQGNCNSCYLFSSLAALESANAIAGKGLYNLSEQQFLDCWKHDCSGDHPERVMFYGMLTGFETFEDYPYPPDKGTQPHKIGPCRVDRSKVVVRVKKYDREVDKNESVLVERWLKKGPFIAALTVGYDDPFMNFPGGRVFKGPCGNEALHGVTVVGFQKNSSEGPYWIIKNSWGTGWADKGYAKMAFGKKLCKITQDTSQPYVVKQELGD